MEQVQCVCGGTKTTAVAKKGILHKGEEPRPVINVICETCGQVFMNPRPTKAEYDKLYSQYGEERHSLDSEAAILEYIKEKEAATKKKGEQLIDFLELNHVTKGSALDIGVGVGSMSVALKNAGWNVDGIEPGVLLAETISKHYDLDIFNGTLEDFQKKYPEKKFDLLVLHHVFEHFTNPTERLRELLGMISSGGLIYIEVPNVASFKKPIGQFFDLLHPYSYSPTTLAKVLKMAGAKIVAFNKEKPYRLQVLIVPLNDTRKIVDDPALYKSNIVSLTKQFIKQRRWADLWTFVKEGIFRNQYYEHEH